VATRQCVICSSSPSGSERRRSRLGGAVPGGEAAEGGGEGDRQVVRHFDAGFEVVRLHLQHPRFAVGLRVEPQVAAVEDLQGVVAVPAASQLQGTR
jgi:hypothetical protein